MHQLKKDEAKSRSICDDIRKIIQISFSVGEQLAAIRRSLLKPERATGQKPGKPLQLDALLSSQRGCPFL